jgi:hypothetical protein
MAEREGFEPSWVLLNSPQPTENTKTGPKPRFCTSDRIRTSGHKVGTEAVFYPSGYAMGTEPEVF